MTDKDFLLKLAFAELAYATNLRSVAKEKLEKAADIMDSAQKHLQEALRTAGYTQNPRLPEIWYSEKYYAKVKEIVR